MKFEEAYGWLNKAQRVAVDKIDGALLVIAGPGTGKTQLLGVRVANILQKTDTAPENILCLTFTESGAAAMRTRLRSLIGPVAAKVNISTYHAFGSDIIYLYNNFTDRPQRNLEAPIDGVKQHKILTSLRDSLRHNDILRSAKVSDLVATIAEVKTARLSAKDLTDIAEVNLEDAVGINAALLPILSEIPRGARFDVVLPFYEEVRAKLAEFVNDTPIAGKVERIGNALLDSLNDVITKQEQSEKPSTSALTRWRDRYFEKDAKNRFVLASTVANKKLLSLANLLALYDEYLTAQGLFDFADMIEEAIRYLCEDDAFRYSVQEKYQYILLDEFQDTNDSQLQLIRLVAYYEKPNIMAVGDDDQAIFAFQGARYSNLMDFKEYFGADVIVLTVNYRSGQPVIDLGASVAGQISERFATKYGVEKKLVAADLTDIQTRIERWEFRAEPSEYGWVAGQISELARAGAEQKSIAVIAPKHKYLEALVPYFGAHSEIKLAYEKRENILESDQMMPLLKMARMVVNLAKVRPTASDILEILSYEFWDIDPLSVLNSVQEARERRTSILSYLQESEDERLQELAKFFSALALKSIDTPLEIMLDYVLGSQPLGDFRSPYLVHFTEKGDLDTINFYENLIELREHVTAYTTKTHLRLRDLVEFVDDYASADQKLINTSPYAEADDAVRLLTAHGAKGLEFDYVFLVSLGNRSWGTGKGNNNTLVLPKNLEFVRHTGATEDEKLRLLFVAVTRAKYNLLLTGSLRDFAGKTAVPLRYLQEAEGVSPFLPEGSREIVSVPEERPALDLLQCSWSRKYDVREANIRAVAMKNMENYRLSATDLTLYVDVIYGGPEEFYLSRVLKRPQARSVELSYGNFVHAVLDKVTKEKIGDGEAVEFYKELVARADIEAEDRDEFLEKGVDNLGVYLRARGDYLRMQGHFSEVVFSRDNLVLDGVPLTGKIDHMMVDEAAKTIEIVDFKTAKYHKEKWDSYPTLWKYKRQLMFYKLLLAVSPKWRDYKVETAVIDFVTPDEEGEVRVKVLEFDEGEMREFARLCGKVYGNVKALEFPDVSGYEKTLRGMKDFVRDLLV
jgi:DNA helicase-2/ATP-dependent DNA helicase PcrA